MFPVKMETTTKSTWFSVSFEHELTIQTLKDTVIAVVSLKDAYKDTTLSKKV